MRTVVELSDIEVTVDGIVYRMVQKEPEPEKFIPFKGQIVSIWSGGHENKVTAHFSHIDIDGMYTGFIGVNEVARDLIQGVSCEPIPNVVQFRPMSELDADYNGPANMLYANGGISYFVHASDMYNGRLPVGFQLLEE